jgi:hypothetical protein
MTSLLAGQGHCLSERSRCERFETDCRVVRQVRQRLQGFRSRNPLITPGQSVGHEPRHAEDATRIEQELAQILLSSHFCGQVGGDCRVRRVMPAKDRSIGASRNLDKQSPAGLRDQ